MALINQNTLFDRLQLYIDKKIGEVPANLKDLFDEYNLKLIAANINQIGTVADNIQSVIDVALIKDDISTIVNTPGLIDDIQDAEQNATNSKLRAWNSEAEAMTADEYATNPLGQEVMEYVSNDDGTFTAVPTSMESAYSYAVQALAAAEGLKFQGIWDISGITDPTVEPPAPVPLEDPNNPGNPLPYENGMYWVVKGDSVYDPDNDGNIDPYPTFGPAIGPYKDGDQILYISSPNIPYNPWMKKRDLVNWDRLVGVPLRVRAALSSFGVGLLSQPVDGDRMKGDLLIEKANPKVMLRNTNVADAVFVGIVDDNGDYSLVKIADDGSFIDTKIRVDSDALTLHLRNDELIWNSSKVWNESNDGSGSGLNADLLDDKEATEFLWKRTADGVELDTLIEDGLYDVINMPTALFGATKGMLLVRNESNNIQQLFQSGNVLATRQSGDNGSTWSAWVQYGSMTFDGTRLSITLPQ